jgi:hypothetical protein
VFKNFTVGLGECISLLFASITKYLWTSKFIKQRGLFCFIVLEVQDLGVTCGDGFLARRVLKGTHLARDGEQTHVAPSA